MKRVLVLVTMLAVFALSAPAFANYILVYKGTVKPNAFDWNNDTLLTTTATCWVILDIDETDGSYDNSAIVLYGKVGGVKVYRTEENDNALYVYLWWEPDYANATQGYIYFYDYDYYTTEGFAVGKAKLLSVGEAGGKRLVVSSPAGNMLFGIYEFNYDATLLDTDQQLYGSARVALDLATATTKAANKAGTGFSVVVTAIENDLEAHGYIWWD